MTSFFFAKMLDGIVRRMMYIRFPAFGKNLRLYSGNGNASITVALAILQSRTPPPMFSKCFWSRSSTRKNRVRGSFWFTKWNPRTLVSYPVRSVSSRET